MSLMCNICDKDISGNQSFTKFDCQHGAHLECYLKDSFYIGVGYHCKTCDNLQISQNAYNTILREVRYRESTDISGIEKMYNENPEFKKDADKCKKLYRVCNANINKFSRKLGSLKKDFRNETKPYEDLIKMIIPRYISLAKESDEYKNALKSKSSNTRIFNHFLRKWNLSGSEVTRFLKVKKLIPYYRERNILNLKYKFCIRYIG
jgi:hypothetical protein